MMVPHWLNVQHRVSNFVHACVAFLPGAGGSGALAQVAGSLIAGVVLKALRVGVRGRPHRVEMK